MAYFVNKSFEPETKVKTFGKTLILPCEQEFQHLWKAFVHTVLGVLTLACLFQKPLHSQILMHCLKIVLNIFILNILIYILYIYLY